MSSGKRLGLIELQNSAPVAGEIRSVQTVWKRAFIKALCLGVKDYVGKNGIPRSVAGTIRRSGLGAHAWRSRWMRWVPNKVEAVMMPSQFTADISLTDARDDGQNIECALQRVIHRTGIWRIQGYAGRRVRRRSPSERPDLTEENLQARIRGTLLMALSNKYGSIVLTTGNKSETAVGYCTLYGDMAGGFAVLKDVSKTMVYRLCHYRNTLGKLSRSASSAARPLPNYALTRPIRTACRPMMYSTPSWKLIWNMI